MILRIPVARARAEDGLQARYNCNLYAYWEKSFKEHRIKDRQDYETHATYIEQNPVRVNLTVTASQYSFSSASNNHSLDPAPFTSNNIHSATLLP
jgi:hypothetical protein